ncbi:ribitol 5-phosphate transferase FKRP-like isoform X2 [Andrena cerasifolii]|uniref:ribitol 5-phosphate transferase FKRP-like isoform X2 n=1 Tax=Andrena cerasifolii TaxID=2819439 RepID=UPI0040377EA7
MRFKFVRTLLVLALLGNIIIWHRIWRLFATQNTFRLLTPSIVTPDPPHKLHRRLARLVTVVIRQFETFENDVTATVESVLHFYPTIPILIVCNELPYPSLELDFANESMENVRLVNLQPEFNHSYDERNPLFYVRTKYVLFLPDGSRLSSKQVMQETLSQAAKLGIVTVPLGRVTLNCIHIDLKVKEWTLKFSHIMGNECDGVSGKHATMVETRLLRKLTDPFLLPFTDALYIQTHAIGAKWAVLFRYSVRLYR